MNYLDLKENWYALYLSIVKNMPADYAIRVMIGTREYNFNNR